MNRRTATAVSAIAVISAAILVPAFAHPGHGKTETASWDPNAPKKVSPETALAIGLKTAEVDFGQIDEVMKLTGSVRARPDRLVAVSPRTAGIVRAIAVQPGDSVKKGDALAEIESQELAKNIYELRRLEADYERQLSDVKKSESLVRSLEIEVPATNASADLAEAEVTRLLLILGTCSLSAIFVLLYTHYRSGMVAVQIMLNVPFALIGSVTALVITREPFSVASLVGFISLTGIATRNGVLMVSHYIHLMTEERQTWSKELIIRGSQERVAPVLMTAVTAGLGLIPLVLSKGEPGKEILYPVAVVILGGLITSTLLDFFVTPAIFYRFGKTAAERLAREHVEKHGESSPREESRTLENIAHAEEGKKDGRSELNTINATPMPTTPDPGPANIPPTPTAGQGDGKKPEGTP